MGNKLIRESKPPTSVGACPILPSNWKSFLDTIPLAALILDGDGRVAQANDPCRNLLRDLLGAHPLLGMVWSEVVTHLFDPVPAVDVRLRDGRPLRVSTHPMLKGPGQLVLLDDVSELRALETRVARVNRLAELGQMMACLAHELRTPIAAAQLDCEVLCKVVEVEHRGFHTVRRLLGRTKALGALVEELLLFARQDSLDMGWVHLGAIWEELESTLLAEGAGAYCHFETEFASNTQLWIHQPSVVSALRNLLINGRRAAGEQGQVQMRFARDGAGAACFEVEDSGPGIAPEHRSRIFEPFFSTETQGLGLGLALAQAVAEAHRGELVLKAPSEPYVERVGEPHMGGANFVLRLPPFAPQCSPRFAYPSHGPQRSHQ